jgi:hypothetical protein
MWEFQIRALFTGSRRKREKLVKGIRRKLYGCLGLQMLEKNEFDPIPIHGEKNEIQ